MLLFSWLRMPCDQLHPTLAASIDCQINSSFLKKYIFTLSKLYFDKHKYSKPCFLIILCFYFCPCSWRYPCLLCMRGRGCIVLHCWTLLLSLFNSVLSHESWEGLYSDLTKAILVEVRIYPLQRADGSTFTTIPPPLSLLKLIWRLGNIAQW